MGAPFHAEIPSTEEALCRLAAAASAYSAEAALSTHVAYQIDMAIEELVTNIIKYGYDDSGAHTITVDIVPEADGRATLTVCDDGHFFNPTEIAKSRTVHGMSRDSDEIDIGGWGLALVRNNASSFTYERRDGRNHTRVVFAPAGSPGGNVI